MRNIFKTCELHTEIPRYFVSFSLKGLRVESCEPTAEMLPCLLQQQKNTLVLCKPV